MDIDKSTLIKCPYCGYEYLPSEIFYPKDFLGTASNIIRDDSGKIICYNNDNMNKHEEYYCDNCGKTFLVDAEIKFISSKQEVDFDDDFPEDLS